MTIEAKTQETKVMARRLSENEIEKIAVSRSDVSHSDGWDAFDVLNGFNDGEISMGRAIEIINGHIAKSRSQTIDDCIKVLRDEQYLLLANRPEGWAALHCKLGEAASRLESLKVQKP